jgi:hypothetical protein
MLQQLGVELNGTLYGLDSTTMIRVCRVFPRHNIVRLKPRLRCTYCAAFEALSQALFISLRENYTMPTRSACGSRTRRDSCDGLGYIDFRCLHVSLEARLFFATRAESNIDAHRRIPHLQTASQAPCSSRGNRILPCRERMRRRCFG